MITLTRAATLAVAAILLGACASGGGDAALTVGAPGRPAGGPTTTAGVTTPTPAPGSVQVACDALTTDEVASAVGNRVKGGTGSGKNCFWGTLVDKGTSVFLSITKPAPPQECTAQRNALPKEATQDPVSGVGTSAVWVWQQVAVLLQGTFLACWPDSIVAVMMTGEKDQAALRTTASNLADRVHSRL
jgi:hypothetical protein